MLEGATIDSVGRAVDMGVIELTGARGESVRIHVQCPFRILGGGTVFLGSHDMRYPQRDAGPDAFDEFTTMYDKHAAALNTVLGQLRSRVSAVTFGRAGHLAVDGEQGLRLEAFPDCSGPVEAWRVLVRHGEHFGFPPDLI